MMLYRNNIFTGAKAKIEVWNEKERHIIHICLKRWKSRLNFYFFNLVVISLNLFYIIHRPKTKGKFEMGKFETINFEGVKIYTAFSKNTFKNFLRLQVDLPMYNFIGEGRSFVDEIYFDSPNNLLASAGILLSKVVEGGKAYFKVEREDYLFEKNFSKEKKIFVHPIGVRDSVSDHMMFLIDGITSFFTTKFSIDFENILKVVVPKIEINSKVENFKILSGTGFKGEMLFEEIKFKNNFTHKKGETNLITIKHSSSKTLLNDFNLFIEKVERYCKEIMPISDTKYQIALRLTK